MDIQLTFDTNGGTSTEELNKFKQQDLINGILLVVEEV